MAYIGKSPTGTGVRQRYYFTATGGETSLSGADDNSNTLAFSDGNYVDVSLNGIALVAGTDYNTSTANTIAGLSALSASDIVEIVVYDIFTVADTVSAKDGGTFSGNVTVNGTMTATSFSGDGSALTGISSNAGAEYFEVGLTTDMTGLTDVTSTVVDFGGSGTVVYDTASNFDSANDAYLLDSSNGVYLISFNCGLRSTTLGNTTADIIAGMAGIEIATDGSTFSGYKVSSESLRNSDQDQGQSMIATGSFIYKATTATTKIRLTAICEMSGSDTWAIESTGAGMFQTSVTSNLNTAKVTWMSVMRIA